MNAMQEAENLGVTTLIEIGGNATLCGFAGQCVQNEQAVFVPSLRKGIGDYKQFLESVKQLYLKGLKLDFQRFYENYNKEKLVLTNYPFERKTFWKERDAERIAESGTKAKAASGSSADMDQLLKKQNEQLLKQKRILENMLR